MEYWEIEQIKSKYKNKLLSKYPEFGKAVYFKGEYGLVLFDNNIDIINCLFTDDEVYDVEALVVRWDTKKLDLEQFFFDYKYFDSHDFRYFDMKEEVKKSLQEALSKLKI